MLRTEFITAVNRFIFEAVAKARQEISRFYFFHRYGDYKGML